MLSQNFLRCIATSGSISILTGINALDCELALPRAPRWTWGLGGQYQASLSGMGIGKEASLSARIDFQHRPRIAYTDNNAGFNSASDRLSASISADLSDPAIRVTVFGRNLLDEVQFGGDTQLPFAGGSIPMATTGRSILDQPQAHFRQWKRAAPWGAKWHSIFKI